MQQSSQNLTEKIGNYKQKLREQLKKKLFMKKGDHQYQACNDIQIETPLMRTDRDELEFSDYYQLQQKVGEGAHAVVYLAIRKQDGLRFAVKKFRTGDPEIVTIIRKTYQISQMLNHPSIIKVRELYIDEQAGYCYQVMEYCDYPSLEKQVAHITEEGTKILIRGILEALVYLHKQGICHRDIKPDNILFNGQQVKLIDFGVSKRYLYKSKVIEMWTSTGTSYYCAPEIYMGGGYNYKIDIWAVGVILYQCVAKTLPFADDTVYGTIDMICKAVIRDQPAITNLLKVFLMKLLNPDPRRRLNAQEALQFPWFGATQGNQQKCMDDVRVHDGLANNSSLILQMSQSQQRDDPNGVPQPIVEAFKPTIHVRQRSQMGSAKLNMNDQ